MVGPSPEGIHRALLAALCAGIGLTLGCVEYFAEPPDLGPFPDGARADVPGDAVEPDCRAYAFRGEIYDCTRLDPCCDDEFTMRLACCECDTVYCTGNVICDGPCEEPPDVPEAAESCMACHNGAAVRDDYSGRGITNPHPFPGAAEIPCTGCHGGDGQGAGLRGSHIAPPPAIGDREHRAGNPAAHFNRTTLSGIDLFTPETYPGLDGRMHTTLDYLQFINPGDLRVVSAGRGCGQEGCHAGAHAAWVPRSLHGTSTGIFSGTRFKVGVGSRVIEHRGDRPSGDSLADTAPRPVRDPEYVRAEAEVGQVGRLPMLPTVARRGGPIDGAPRYAADGLAAHVIDAAGDPDAPNRIASASPLEDLIDAQLDLSCGGCHLHTAGRNDRYGDFRAAGCSACHMEYSSNGRHRGFDPNVPRDEPADPDRLEPGERAHVIEHQIRNVAKILPNGAFVRGVSDLACVGCHQGGDRIVLQYWGIRPDENRDVTGGTQYPIAPATSEDTAQDQRLFNAVLGNRTFTGLDAQQLVLREDHDGDGRDDTPPDVHHEAGLGCIDCHGSRDLHGGTAGDPSSGAIRSRDSQGVAIRCVSCHGTAEAFAETRPCTTYTDDEAECAVDARGNAVRHVTRDGGGHFWLTSRRTGQRHYVPQVRDLVVLGRPHPLTAESLYSGPASFAMGRADDRIETGLGPRQAAVPGLAPAFSHLDTVDCAACHAAWSNTCIGCHLGSAYDDDAGTFGWTTGEPLVLRESARDLVYASPLMAYLGVDHRGRIARMTPSPKMFWRYTDADGRTSPTMAFGDRLGEGFNPARNGRGEWPALGLNPTTPHAIRGAPTLTDEGVLSCAGCHLNAEMLADAEAMARYDAFAAAYDAGRFDDIDFDALAVEIGQNPGNQRNSPFFVRMMAGLGTGLFLFDEDGCPVNPLDDRVRAGCDDRSPAARFPTARVAFDLDRLVEVNGMPNVSGSHPRLTADGVVRDGASNANMAGPLGMSTLRRLVGGGDIRRGLVLDTWRDADGQWRGRFAEVIPEPER